ncbi:root hair defective 3 GTP-binding protein [Striga asiatica]|uniref:Root hair defective 3 GTP-binding protein n=1 Tax=Striga asiatica TaxID=4170 RepID=A0A5A7QEJ5_STRAF|nr:root hair defective 3 GTP-binding protein [Striga asiatica]
MYTFSFKLAPSCFESTAGPTADEFPAEREKLRQEELLGIVELARGIFGIRIEEEERGKWREATAENWAEDAIGARTPHNTMIFIHLHVSTLSVHELTRLRTLFSLFSISLLSFPLPATRCAPYFLNPFFLASFPILPLRLIDGRAFPLPTAGAFSASMFSIELKNSWARLDAAGSSGLSISPSS